MNKLFISSAVALTLTSTHLAAGPIHGEGDIARFGMAHPEQIWLVQGNNGNGNGNDKGPKKGHGHAGKGNAGNGKAHAGHGNAKPGKGKEDAAKGNRKPEHAGGPKFKTNGKGVGHASQGNGKGAKDRRPFTTAERGEAFSRILSTPAPTGRDMKRVLSATALALATPQLLVADIPEDELITYRNCPPGLAKKDPPCVPPGLANKGVTYDEWVSYDQEEYDTIWVERRDEWIRSEAGVDPDPELLLLQSDQIATLADRIAPLGDLCDPIALEVVSEIACAHHGLLASKLAKKASTKHWAIQRTIQHEDTQTALGRVQGQGRA